MIDSRSRGVMLQRTRPNVARSGNITATFGGLVRCAWE